jgi:hypothetical protein
MKLKRWSVILLMMGLFLFLIPLSSSAQPFPPYGNAYGWSGPRHHAYARHHRNFRHFRRGPHHARYYVEKVYAGPPPVAYAVPVMPVIQQPYPPVQLDFSSMAPPGLHGQITF